jgi:glycosyltransferase involved in cell wall biosynthesis
MPEVAARGGGGDQHGSRWTNSLPAMPGGSRIGVLYVNHTALVSGGEHSLLELLGTVAGHGVDPVLACPPGRLADRAPVKTLAIPGTEGSLALHPLRTPRALAEIGRAAWAVRAAARRSGASLVHANSIRAGLIAIGARALGGPPVVVHVRDALPPGRASEAVAAVIRRGAAGIISNSAFTERRLLNGRRARGRTAAIHNPIDLARFAGRVREPRRGPPTLALVAQITPWKGQADAIEALALVRHEHPDARLLLAGEAKFVSAATRHDNAAYLASLRARAAELGPDAVELLGEVRAVEDVYAAADLVLCPSWEEPWGRSVAEAMASGACVLATTEGGPAEFMTDGEDGRLLAPRDPQRWARAILDLLADEPARRRLGERAAVRARAFDRDAHAAAVRAFYDAVLS